MEKHPAHLFEKLREHQQGSGISFHVPGHKMGVGFNPRGKDYFADVLKIDLTEITGLDDLHQPTGVIAQAQEKAAKVFKARKTFFLVNGSTAGNLAMILAVCRPGDKLLVQRNVHKSVINGILLARAKPIYLYPEVFPELGIAGGIAKEQVSLALAKHPDVKAVLLMNPNYYGIGSDLSQIAEIVHQSKIPLLVDEAHGAHFGFHQAFPDSAIKMGADVVVQSTHKTLTAMTMGSMLHLNNNSYISEERLRFFLGVFQSSSPSYPIMASLDLTTQLLAEKGEELWDKQLEVINWLNNKGTSLRNIELISKAPKGYYKDPLKIIIHSKKNEISGFLIQNYLAEKRIYTELADFYNALAIITMGNEPKDLEQFFQELTNLDKFSMQMKPADRQDMNKKLKEDIWRSTHISDYSMSNSAVEASLDEVINGQSRAIPIDQAIGELAAEMIIPYPPGIPFIHLGEVITKEAVEELKELQRLGANFQGINDPELKTIRIVIK